MIGQTIANYKIISLLGEGGMANVYLAQHQSLGNKVALKLLKEEYVQHPNIRKRFLAEARSLAQMAHPNIIKVTDLIDAGDIVAFVMEYIEGQTLEEFLFKKGELTQTEIESFFNQMILAVEYVHSQGLIHRDIKPSNFMVTKNGVIKLLDFGIAKNTNEGAVDYTKTSLMQQMGTPLYMSPEQVKNTAEVTKQTDIYSLGVLLWQLVMNKKPYDSGEFSLPEIQVSILKEPLSLTHTIWDSTIQDATEKDPTKRFLKINSKKGVESKSVSDTEIDHAIPRQNPKNVEQVRITYFNFKTISIGIGILLFVGILIINLSKDGTTDNSVATIPDNEKTTPIVSSPKLKIGQKYQGGIIFYLDNSGKHGKVCTEKDLGEFYWDAAMEECRDLSLNGFNDWYLPTENDLHLLYIQKHVMPSHSDYYWSSTEGDNGNAWVKIFANDFQSYFNKNVTSYVRAVRAF